VIQRGLEPEEFHHRIRREQADESAILYDRYCEGLARIESAHRGIEHVVRANDLHVTLHHVGDGRLPTVRGKTTEDVTASEDTYKTALSHDGEVMLASML
jgi:hypothetical protein